MGAARMRIVEARARVCVTVLRKNLRSRLHTHLVRGGSLMLEPTKDIDARLPLCSAYPPRERWVPNGPAYKHVGRSLDRFTVGSSIGTRLARGAYLARNRFV